jgi:tetraacyldisaccharide 4'-kinase
MGEALQRAWLRRGPLACLLWPLSLVYRALVAVRRFAHQAGWLSVRQAAVPVVVVGNVVAGGAGKTPVVMALAEHFTARGIRTGVVSRGHGRVTRDCRAVLPGADPAQVGDEPLLVATRCRVPVFVAPRRADAVDALLRAHPSVQLVLSDDGLQHHAMGRQVEVCVFDARGVGNGWLLPAGPLREPWPRPVDLVLTTPETPGIAGWAVRRALADFAWRADGARRPLAEFTAQPCDALAGIAQPERFFAMLAAAGIQVRRRIALPDHHAFSAAERHVQDDVPLLCTEKDAVKLWRQEPRAWAVPLAITIEPGFWPALEARLSSQLSSFDGSETP